MQRALAGGPLPAPALLALQQAAGNAAVSRLIVQRTMHDRYKRQWADALELGVVTAEEVERLRVFVTERDPKDAVLDLVSLSNWLTKVFKNKARKRQIQSLLWRHLARNGFDVPGAKLLRASLLQSESEALSQGVGDVKEALAVRKLPGVVYRDPPLDEPAGRAILEAVTAGAPQPLAGLDGAVPTYGDQMVADYAHPIQHEWGLGRAAGGEFLVIVGDATGVNWGAYVDKGLVPVAHAHPYFRRKRALETKVIGGDGVLPVAQLATTINNKQGGEILKTFPSAGDVGFCARKGYQTHTVYTPYVYIDVPNPALANPTPQTMQRPRVTFEIRQAAATDTEGVYTCDLVMVAGGQRVWAQDRVTADTTVGGGGLGVLRW